MNGFSRLGTALIFAVGLGVAYPIQALTESMSARLPEISGFAFTGNPGNPGNAEYRVDTRADCIEPWTNLELTLWARHVGNLIFKFDPTFKKNKP